MKNVWKIVIAVIIVIAIMLGILYVIDMGRMKQNKTVFFSNWGKKPTQKVFSNQEEQPLTEKEKYANYEKTTTLQAKGISTEVLVKFNGILYGQSGKLIDYVGGAPKIGTIDKLIPSKYVPKLDGETNCTEILGAEVYENTENEIVLNYQNAYRLFEKIKEDTKEISVITYQILNVVESNDEEYLYLTIRKYQAEEVETVKVKKKLAKDVKSDKSYEFTFQYKVGTVEENIKSIFQNAELISIVETDKKGMDQRQDFIQCPSEKVFNL